MNRDRHNRLFDVVARARDLPVGERSDFVKLECGDDSELLEDAIELLDEETGGGLGLPLVGLRSELQPGDILGERYRIVGVLGRGAQGMVYEAEDRRVGKRIAIKQMLGRDELSLRLFEREARILGLVRNSAPASVAVSLPNVTDFFTEADGLYLAMDFVSGETLAQRLESIGGPLAVEEVLAVGDRILSVLEFLHGHKPDPIIHRDIKPQNIKIAPDGHLVLLDFGLTKGAIAKLSRLGRGTSVFAQGTQQYAPWEQMKDGLADERSDLYSLGATMYRLLTGVKFPDVFERQETLARSLPDPLLLASEVNPAVPRIVAIGLRRALQLNPDERFQDATEMRDALRLAVQAGDSQPIVAVESDVMTTSEVTKPRTGERPATRRVVVQLRDRPSSPHPIPGNATSMSSVGRLRAALGTFAMHMAYLLLCTLQLLWILFLAQAPFTIANYQTPRVVFALLISPPLMWFAFLAYRHRWRAIMLDRIAIGRRFAWAIGGLASSWVLFVFMHGVLGRAALALVVVVTTGILAAEWQENLTLPMLAVLTRWLQSNWQPMLTASPRDSRTPAVTATPVQTGLAEKSSGRRLQESGRTILTTQECLPAVRTRESVDLAPAALSVSRILPFDTQPAIDGRQPAVSTGSSHSTPARRRRRNIVLVPLAVVLSILGVIGIAAVAGIAYLEYSKKATDSAITVTEPSGASYATPGSATLSSQPEDYLPSGDFFLDLDASEVVRLEGAVTDWAPSPVCDLMPVLRSTRNPSSIARVRTVCVYPISSSSGGESVSVLSGTFDIESLGIEIGRDEYTGQQVPNSSDIVPIVNRSGKSGPYSVALVSRSLLLVGSSDKMVRHALEASRGLRPRVSDDPRFASAFGINDAREVLYFAGTFPAGIVREKLAASKEKDLFVYLLDQSMLGPWTKVKFVSGWVGNSESRGFKLTLVASDADAALEVAATIPRIQFKMKSDEIGPLVALFSSGTWIAEIVTDAVGNTVTIRHDRNEAAKRRQAAAPLQPESSGSQQSAGVESTPVRLGVVLEAVTPGNTNRAQAASGCIVSEVVAGSLAESLGLRPGDVIYRIGDRDVRTVDEFRAAVAHYSGLRESTVIWWIRRRVSYSATTRWQ